MTANEIISVIPLIEGKFSPEEALEIIETMVDDRARLHDIQMLRKWEGNHQFDEACWYKKLGKMQLEKDTARTVISAGKKEGYKVEIVGTIQVKLSKPVASQSKL